MEISVCIAVVTFIPNSARYLTRYSQLSRQSPESLQVEGIAVRWWSSDDNNHAHAAEAKVCLRCGRLYGALPSCFAASLLHLFIISDVRIELYSNQRSSPS